MFGIPVFNDNFTIENAQTGDEYVQFSVVLRLLFVEFCDVVVFLWDALAECTRLTKKKISNSLFLFRQSHYCVFILEIEYNYWEYSLNMSTMERSKVAITTFRRIISELKKAKGGVRLAFPFEWFHYFIFRRFPVILLNFVLLLILCGTIKWPKS